MLNRSDKNRHPCLVVCHKWPLLSWDMFPLFPLWWEVFIMNGSWISSNALWDGHLIFVFPFVNVVYHIYCFEYVEASLCPWNESSLLMVYDCFNVLLDLVCSFFFWGILHLCSSSVILDCFLFLWYLCLALISWWCLPSRINSEDFVHLQFFAIVSEG